MLTQPEAKVEITPPDEPGGVTKATITQEGKRVTAESKPDDTITAEALGVPLPAGAKRLAGIEVESLSSDIPYLPAAEGSRFVEYEVPCGMDEAVAFYSEHPSAKIVLLGDMREMGMEAVLFGVSDRPSVFVGVQPVEGKTHIRVVDLTGTEAMEDISRSAGKEGNR